MLISYQHDQCLHQPDQCLYQPEQYLLDLTSVLFQSEQC